MALAENNIIEIQDLPSEIIPSTLFVSSNESVPIYIGDTIEIAEKKLILATLAYCDNNKRKASQILGMSERHLYNKLNQYELEGIDSK